MKTRYLNIFFVLLILCPGNVNAQNDIQPPLAPLLTFVSVQQETGFSLLNWTLSSSPDVAGYVLYSYKNGEGYAFDTIWDPTATSYVFPGSAAAYYSEAYVIAAIDYSYNISPLSNGLNTIFSSVSIDTCRKVIEIKWNYYPDSPKHVSGYKIFVSANGNTFTEIARVGKLENRYAYTDFETDSRYCFIVKADLDEPTLSSSNKTCIDTRMQRPPDWINADYANVTDNKEIALSFSYDPQSGIKNFILERKEGLNGSFTKVTDIHSHANPVTYIDEPGPLDEVYYYRLSAINNCNSPVKSSNIAGNILPSLEISGGELNLKWNPYREWNGDVQGYRIYSDINGTYESISVNAAADTVYSILYSDIMYNITGNRLCFFIEAFESGNQYVTNGLTRSSVVCSDIMENINVPNVFTPNNDLINDTFKPVLSFTPKDYQLTIRDRRGYTVFETRNHLSEWDGQKNGTVLPPDAYLWFLNVTAPSGKVYSKTGTITILLK